MKKIMFVILIILLIGLTGCFGQAIGKSESAQEIAKYQVKIDKIGKKMGAVLIEIQTDSNELSQGKITEEKMIQRLEKKLSKLRNYNQELNSLTSPPVYQEAHNYMISAMQKTINAVELMRQAILQENLNLLDQVVQMLTEVGADVTTAKTLLAQGTQQIMPAGQSPSSASASPMNIDEYKSFMQSMDSQISGTLGMLDQSIAQFRQKQITKEDFLFGINEALKTLESAENAFINAMPPSKFSRGHFLLSEGVGFLKEGIVIMKQAVEQSNDETYKKAVTKFQKGIQTIQQGNEEIKNNL
ncbi:hypothetical protein KY304_01215 [Candidatus Woesearchaeota archaeon]|nr:hypothetical protein [Candidatus Woesearchaeota archaeon]